MKTNKFTLFLTIFITILTAVAQAIEPGDIYASEPINVPGGQLKELSLAKVRSLIDKQAGVDSVLVIHSVDSKKGEITVSARSRNYAMMNITLTYVTTYPKNGLNVAEFVAHINPESDKSAREVNPYTKFTYVLEIHAADLSTPPEEILKSSYIKGFKQITYGSRVDRGMPRTSALVHPYYLVGNDSRLNQTASRSAKSCVKIFSQMF